MTRFGSLRRQIVVELRFCCRTSIDILEELIMMVLFLIGLMALIGAGLMIISGIQAIISLGIALIIKMILGLAGIVCGILLLMFVVAIVEDLTSK
nr:MAG TPA: hypothetical protein [Caudoviricetes sp.]